MYIASLGGGSVEGNRLGCDSDFKRILQSFGGKVEIRLN